MIIRMLFLSAMSIMMGNYTSIVLWLAIRFDIEHLTGKEAIELVRLHQKF